MPYQGIPAVDVPALYNLHNASHGIERDAADHASLLIAQHLYREHRLTLTEVEKATGTRYSQAALRGK